MPEKSKNENENTNASGSPTGPPISSLYLDFARKALPEELRVALHLADGASYADGLVKVLFEAALKGNLNALREIRESVEGKATQRRNPEGPQKFELVVTYDESPLLKMVPKDNPDPPL